MSTTKEMAEQLNELLEKNYDSEKGFKNAAEDVKNSRLKSYFEQKAQQRYDFGHELKSEIRNLGEDPDKGTSLKGDAHRAWMDLKTAFSSDNEEAVLEEAIRGEKVAVEDYNKIINNAELPPSTVNLLIKQRNAIERTLNEVKGLEEAFD
ncbi:ferritin-like domain-containing protein [Salinimicrobium oceani]|uniref:PA2169 family four-helix-bundle protein n=1 Tax=Salinimicrobium oceani TaxID=2722702 RepID=A0ABX1D088_9FLAO|nr:PA2169 family four-helix-bundle protein [Salinimicrobium oceani]NJW53039.1 PA2169 family four-helix-bundle protein [Salinimicrobium oceani]